LTINTNGTETVTADLGYTGLSSVEITTQVPQPSIQNYKGRTFTANTDGIVRITPDTGYDAMTEVGVRVSVPSDVNNQNREITISSNGNRTVTYDSGYSGLGQVKIITNVPQGETINNQEKSLQPTENHVWYTVEPDAGYTGLSKVTVRPNITPILEDRTITISSNGEQIISAQSGYEGMSSCKITTNVQPKLEERTVDITSNGTTEITPQGFLVQGISKVTINTNVPTGTSEAPLATKIRYNATDYNIKDGFAKHVNPVTGFNIAPGNALILIKEETERYAIYTFKNKSTNANNITINIASGEFTMSFLEADAVFYFENSLNHRLFGTNDSNLDDSSSPIYMYKRLCTLDLPS